MMLAVFVRIVWIPGPSVAALLIVSTISAVFAMLSLVLTFAFRFVTVVSLYTFVESSSESLNRLMELCCQGFRFNVGRFVHLFHPGCIDSDFCIELLCRHLLELEAFGIHERFPFLRGRSISHERVQKLEVDDRYCQIRCSSRLVVIDIINKLFKSIDVIVHRRFIVLFEQGKVVGGSYILEIGGTTILIMESLQNCMCIVLNIDQFEEFSVHGRFPIWKLVHEVQEE